MEDVEIMRRIKKKGGAITIINKNAATSARRWKKEGVLTGTLRNKVLKLMYNLGVAPEKLARYYR